MKSIHIFLNYLLRKQRYNFPLDSKIYSLKKNDKTPWGFNPISLSIASVFIGLIILSIFLNIYSIFSREKNEHQETVALLFSAFGTMIMGLIAYVSVKKVAQRNGGWARVFGVTSIKLQYILYGFIAYILFLLINIITSSIFDAIHTNASKEGSNVNTLTNKPYILLLSLLIASIIAPIVEEFIFRGIMLRAFMYHYNYWISSSLSSIIFSLFHIMQVNTFFGALVLGTTLFILAMIMCWLNRITDSIIPGIFAHILNNSFVLIISFYSR